MAKVLLAWVGHADLQAVNGDKGAGDGPIARAVTARSFNEVVLLSSHSKQDSSNYVRWLKKRSPARVQLYRESLSSPTEFGEIYEAVVRVVSDVLKNSENSQLTFHLSPGTPAMAAVWIILGKTRFPAEFIESSQEYGVRTASVPFDISADFIPDLLRQPDAKLERLITGLPVEAPEFADIICRSRTMKHLIAKARRIAPRSVSVLIEGESGTGKELIARAIHKASPRRDNPFVAVNCGAIPVELIESELFGHEKGAFTGATASRAGYFEAAHNGTLFLDELGELSMPAQVKLLRTVQEGEVLRIGSNKPREIDVRIIGATNRTLLDEIAAGRFREDLFYRLAVILLKLPPLRERVGDLSLLTEYFLRRINEETRIEPGYKEKHLSAGAKNLLFQHTWPGNVRELYNTLLRAAIWAEGSTIELNDIQEALLPMSGSTEAQILNQSLGENFDLQELLETVASHYLKRAWTEAHGNKTKAAQLVGLPSYQTFTNWINRYGVEI